MPCDQSLSNLSKTLASLNPASTKFARFSQGSGVVAFPSENVPLYVGRVRAQIHLDPYDRVLIAHWTDKPDFVALKHFFYHIGKVSTITSRNTPEYRKLYSSIRDNTCNTRVSV